MNFQDFLFLLKCVLGMVICFMPLIMYINKKAESDHKIVFDKYINSLKHHEVED